MSKIIPVLFLLTVSSSAASFAVPICWSSLSSTTTVTNTDNFGNTWVTVTYYFDTVCGGSTIIRDKYIAEGQFTLQRFDDDEDGSVDNWKDVLKTADPCANNFDKNDRLGSNHGGINTDRPTHKGVDIQADFGDPVRSMGDGIVRVVGWQSSDHTAKCGYWVQIDHDNGWRSYSCHLIGGSSPLNVGERVYAGQYIGRADSTGNSTGNHLHLVYKKGTNRREYFDFVDQRPTSSQLNQNGC